MVDLPHRQLLELDLLRTFESVVHLGGFTAAAERLHRTQSTVSAQIRRLEELTGNRLMDRNNQGVTLTPAGETLLTHARRLLALNDEAMGSIGAHDEGGRVRLGVPADYTSTFLSSVLPVFGRAFPNVELVVNCDLSENLRAELVAGRLDLIIGTFDRNAPAGEVIRAEPLVWAGAKDGHTWAKDPLPLAVFPPGCQFREIALERLSAVGKRFRVAYTSPGMAAIEVAVSTDFAVAPVTRGSLRGDMRELGEEQGLPQLPIVEITLHTGTGLPSPAERLAECIRERATAG